MSAGAWTIIVAPAAERDFQNIVRWIADHFGIEQGRTYSAILSAALDELKEGPEAVFARRRPELGQGIRVFHSARHGRRGRHIIVFRVLTGTSTPTLQVLRILHDAMDIRRHLAPDQPDQ